MLILEVKGCLLVLMIGFDVVCLEVMSKRVLENRPEGVALRNSEEAPTRAQSW